MKIKSAEFVISNSRADLCPVHGMPEYAFIGRSNVGKSSLINCLVERKALAMTSSTPGKTLLINHFLINATGTSLTSRAMAMLSEARKNRKNLAKSYLTTYRRENN